MDKLKQKMLDYLNSLSNNKLVIRIMSIQRIPYRILVGVSLLMILGFVYTFLAKIPIITYILPWIYGYLSGYIGWYSVKNFKNDWFIFKAITAIFATIVAMYFNWMFFIKAEYDVLLIWPFSILSALGEIAEGRTVTIVGSSSIPITGIWLMLCWLLELILVFIGCWDALTKIFNRVYLCPKCKEWSSELLESTDFENTLTLDQIQAIKCKDFSQIEQLKPSVNSEIFITYVLQRCGNCNNGAFSLILNKFKTNIEGERKLKKKYIIRHLECSEDEFSSLSERMIKQCQSYVNEAQKFLDKIEEKS